MNRRKYDFEKSNFSPVYFSIDEGFLNCKYTKKPIFNTTIIEKKIVIKIEMNLSK